MGLFERLGIESCAAMSVGRTAETRAHETIDNDAQVVDLRLIGESEITGTVFARTMLTKADNEGVDQGLPPLVERNAGLLG